MKLSSTASITGISAGFTERALPIAGTCQVVRAFWICTQDDAKGGDDHLLKAPAGGLLENCPAAGAVWGGCCIGRGEFISAVFS